MPSQTGLRYRGSNQLVKKYLANHTASSSDIRELLPNNIGVNQNFLTQERFQNPPSGVKASHAYQLDDSLYAIFKKFIPHISFRSVKNMFGELMSLINQSPTTIKNHFDNASLEEKSFIETMTHQIKDQPLIKKNSSELHVNSILCGVMLLACRLSATTAAQSLPTSTTNSLIFFNGSNPSGWDACKDSTANFCEQFYTRLSSSHIVTIHTTLTSTHIDPQVVKNVAGCCGDAMHLQQFLTQFVNMNSEKALEGHSGCASLAFGLEKTVAVINVLNQVSPLMFDALREYFKNSVQPCVENRLQNLTETTPCLQPPNSFSSTNSESSISTTGIALIVVIAIAAAIPVAVGVGYMLDRQKLNRVMALANARQHDLERIQQPLPQPVTIELLQSHENNSVQNTPSMS